MYVRVCMFVRAWVLRVCVYACMYVYMFKSPPPSPRVSEPLLKPENEPCMFIPYPDIHETTIGPD